jgi:hypothetical protein
MKLLLGAVSALTIACASAAPEAPEPVASAQMQTPDILLTTYSGTYSLQAPSRVIGLRVWVDGEGNLNGQLVSLSEQTTFRPSDTPHKFLHATRDDIWFLFTIENGRATMATMHQRGREISGPRKD